MPPSHRQVLAHREGGVRGRVRASGQRIVKLVGEHVHSMLVLDIQVVADIAGNALQADSTVPATRQTHE